VGSTSATLNAHGYTSGKQGQAFFQYSSAKNALGTGFGLQTPTLRFPPNLSGPFTAQVSGLSPGTNYWFRVCGNDVGDQPHCNGDLEFTTTVAGAAVAFGPPLGIAGMSVLAMGDFNGDGVADLVVGGSGTSFEVLLNNGDATFREGGTLDVGAYSFSLAVGDFNRDGRPDLVSANFDAADVSILLGRGDGTFQNELRFAVGDGPFGGDVGDFNGDGFLDLAVANDGSAADLSVLLGRGDGTFGQERRLAVGGAPESVKAGDFNGDGRLDLAVANFGSNDVSVLLGNGDGSFQTQPRTAAGQGPVSVVAGDFRMHASGRGPAVQQRA